LSEAPSRIFSGIAPVHDASLLTSKDTTGPISHHSNDTHQGLFSCTHQQSLQVPVPVIWNFFFPPKSVCSTAKSEIGEAGKFTLWHSE
jgi:hypothetical protein